MEITCSDTIVFWPERPSETTLCKKHLVAAVG